MALNKNVVPIPFAQGIDTKTDSKQVPIGKLLSLQNATLITPTSLTKRNGYTALSTSIIGGGTISNGVFVSPYKNELVELDGSALYSYGETPLAPALKGYIQPISVSTTAAYQQLNLATTNSGSIGNIDTGFIPGFKFVAASYQTNNDIIWELIDQTTGSISTSGTIATSNQTSPVKVLALGTKFYIFFLGDNLYDTLGFRSFDTSTLIMSGATTIAGVGKYDPANKAFDATVIKSQIFIAYPALTAGATLRVARIATNGSLSGTEFTANETVTTCITAFGDTANSISNLWVAYYNGTAVKYLISDFPDDPTLANPIVLSPTVVQTVANINNITGINILNGFSASNGYLFYEQTAALTYNYKILTAKASLAGSVGLVNAGIDSLSLTSKAFNSGGTSSTSGVTYFWATYTSAANSFQSTHFLIAADLNATPGTTLDFKTIARIYSGTALKPTFHTLGEVNSTDASNLFNKTNFFTGLISESSFVISGVSGVNGITTYAASIASFSMSPAVMAVEIADSLYITGGHLWQYDGTNVVPHGYNVFPETPTFVASTSGGFLTDSASYQYIVVYEWVDSRGRMHRSATSVAGTVSTGASGGNTNKVVLTMSAPGVFLNKPLYTQAIFRTTANGTIFYREGVPSTPGATTYTSTISDTALVAGQQLYTTGGEVENSPGPACTAICSFKDRLVLLPSESASSWWFSKEPVTGFGLEMSSFLVQNETSVGGLFTACKQLDDKLILFKNNNPFYVVGNGPAPNGAGNDYSPALQVASDTGCNNPVSVVLMPDGLMRQSAKGIYLLDRSLGDRYVGADVEFINDHTVTGAQLIPSTTQVRFSLNNVQGSPNNQITLVYDYFPGIRDQMGNGQWSKFTPIAAVSACIFQGFFTYITSAGLVLQETAGLYTDNGAGIQLSAQTAWLKLAQIQGFQRVWKMILTGTYQSAHTLQVQTSYDFDTTIRQTDNITASATPPYVYRINFARQKCQAIQLTIQDTSPTGQSMSLSALTFEVGVNPGVNRIAASRSFG